MASKTAHERETAILRHLADGPRPLADFSQGMREERRHAGKPMSTTAVGGYAGLIRCWRAGWAEEVPQNASWEEPWQITNEGRAELERRQS